MIAHIVQFCYLVATGLFVLSLKWLSHPSTARRGVLAGVCGMTAAITGTLLFPEIVEYRWIVVALIVGTCIGIPLSRIWVIVWSVAGAVALVVGVIWGSKLGVQFSLSVLALKGLPVVILGGLTSVPGAIIGGLIIGVGEKLAEVYVGPSFGGGIEIWFGYVLALLFLLVRPQGLFGEKIIDRV